MKRLIVDIPDGVKYRLDRFALEKDTTIKEVVTKILDEKLPQYTQERE